MTQTRLDRLELVVRSLADRILGEDITFDAIAEQEAAEQGVAYVAPAVEPSASREEIVADVLSRIPIPEPQPVPDHSRVEAVEERLTALATCLAGIASSVAEGMQSLAPPPAFDPSQIQAEITDLRARVALLEKRSIEQERAVQLALQVADTIADGLALERKAG